MLLSFWDFLPDLNILYVPVACMQDSLVLEETGQSFYDWFFDPWMLPHIPLSFKDHLTEQFIEVHLWELIFFWITSFY